MKIVWTHTAKSSFTKILDYLFENWTKKEVDKFADETRKTLYQIIENPYMFQASKKNKAI